MKKQGDYFFLTGLLVLGMFFNTGIMFGAAKEDSQPFRIGIIGTTTSHVPAALSIFNDRNAKAPFDRFEITSVYTGGMPDNPDSWNRREKYTRECVKAGLTVYKTVEELVQNVDGVMLESVDGRPHLEQAKPVIAAKKPLFIDKPVAGSLYDVLEIYRLAQENGTPIFSASSLRYVSDYQKMRNEKPLGKVLGADAASPASLNPKHPDLYWYGVHGVESLFTILGPDCISVGRVKTDTADVAVGIWSDNRIGTFRGTRAGKYDYCGFVFCEKGNAAIGRYEGYQPLFRHICQFFSTGKAPVDPQETIQIFAFMSAADESWAQGGKQISLAETIATARAQKQVETQITLSADNQVKWNGESVPLDRLADRVDQAGRNGRVRVILDNRAGASFETVQKVLVAIDKAYLANYLY